MSFDAAWLRHASLGEIEDRAESLRGSSRGRYEADALLALVTELAERLRAAETRHRVWRP